MGGSFDAGMKSRVRSTSDLIIRIQMAANILSVDIIQIHIYHFDSNNVNISNFTHDKTLNMRGLFGYFGWRHRILASAKTISQSL